MEEGHAETSPATDVGCRMCGAALGPYELMCPSCGAMQKPAPDAGLPPELRELRDIANGAIAQASADLAHAHRVGVCVDLADDLLAMAKKAATEGNFGVALDLASRSGEEAESLTVQAEALQNRVRQAKRAIAAAREDGADVRDCEELLEMAHEAAGAGDYRNALRLALKAAQHADRGRGRYQAWKVEISDWLK